MTAPADIGEISRVLGLPRVHYTPPDGVSWSEVLRSRPDAPPLFEDQESFLTACAHAADTTFDAVQGSPGVAGFMGCGAGKTLALLLAPLIFGVPNYETMYLTQASLLNQLHRDVEQWSQWYPVKLPMTLSYGKLSHPAHRSDLFLSKPKLILADEFHRIGQKARYKRLFEYLETNPQVRLVGVSGSFMKDSLERLQSMLSLILRSWSPVPYNDVLDHWGCVLDIGGEYGRLDMDSVRPLIRWAKEHGMKVGGTHRYIARRAFRERLQSAPGVVVTTGKFNVHATLTMHVMIPQPTAELQRLEQLWELPDGTELVDTLEIYRHRRSMRLGFYTRWRPETVHDEFVEARSNWMRVVRAYEATGHFQSKWFIEQAAQERRLRQDSLDVWDRWCVAREKFEPPEGETVWFEPKILKRVVSNFIDASDDPERVSIWYHNIGVADMLMELGVVPVCRSGQAKPRFGPVAVPLSFSTGWSKTEHATNFCDSLILQPPSSADAMEQLLARHHRTGQDRDVTYTLYGDDADRAALMQKAGALQALTGNTQRILVAEWPGFVTR